MAKTYKELAADLARRKMTDVSDLASSAVDKIVYAPAKAVEAVHNIKESMTTKAEVLGTVIEAKLLIEDRFLEDIEKSEFAYALAQNPNLLKTVSQLTDQILQPTPVEASPEVKENGFINIGAGVSAFWAEMQKKLPIEIQDAIEVENVLMSLNAGLDKTIEPDTRKMFLKEAGLNVDQVNELVPISDYVLYEEHLKETVRADVMQEFGFGPEHELSEEERLQVESIVEDRLLGIKIQMDELPENCFPTYEELYGISAEDMYRIFGEETEETEPAMEEPTAFSDKEEPKAETDWQAKVEASQALDGYWEMLNATVEDNMAMLAEIEGIDLSEQYGKDDVAFVQGLSELDDALLDEADHFSRGISEADLALAEQMDNEESL